MKKLILLLCFSISACSVNPFSPDSQQYTGTATGTAVGAAAGFGTTTLLNASKGTIAAGTLLGAGIGYYASSLRFASRGIIRGGGQVFTLGDYLTIDLPSDNLFDSNSDQLIPEAAPILDSTAEVLKRYGRDNIIISGNTSGFYMERYERQLSTDRARQVAAYLWSRGINNFQEESNDERALTFVGYGNYFPIANDIRNKSIRQNSHIQITAYPSKDQLMIENKCAAFNNVGGLGNDQPSLCKPSRPYVNLNKEFSN